MTEAAFLAEVLKLAKLYGWLTMHIRPAWTSKGYRTPVQGDGAGFPDLVLAKPPRVIFAELKSAGGKTSIAQKAWLLTLNACRSVETYLWQPSDLLEIAKVLEG